MTLRSKFLTLSLMCLLMFISSCVPNVKVSGIPDPTINNSSTDHAPVVSNIVFADFYEDIPSIMTLPYTDADSDMATSCELVALSNVIVTQACSCNLGVCTVGISGAVNYSGVAGFSYTVTANNKISNLAEVSFSVLSVDAPVAANITAMAFNEDTQNIITLSYTDTESDLATTCSLSALTNVSVTQACSCNGLGVCTVGVTGESNYSGAASFRYTVTGGGATSNSAEATFSILPIDDAPEASSITPLNFNEDSQSIITLAYTDTEFDFASTCSISAPSNVAVTQACTCLAGVCTVGVTGSANYSGAAGFSYTITANGRSSNSASATFTILAVDDTLVAADIAPLSFNEDIESIITLSYSDSESDEASACSISALSNVTVTQPCACNGSGVCTVGVTGTINYNGAASFNYSLSANGATSNSALATLDIAAVDDPPVIAAVTLADLIFEDIESDTITLNYTDADNDRAAVNGCTISNLNHVTVPVACTCDIILGTCSLKVKGELNYSGNASFDYQISTTTNTPAAKTVSLTIVAVNDSPVATNISPLAFDEDVQSIITLSYSDADSDLATGCSISALSNVTVSQDCVCNASGVCSVGIKGSANYSGAASFNYTVTANSAVSNAASATLSILAVDDAPVASAMTPSDFDEDIQSIVTLSYTDAEADSATACAISALSNVTVTQACACALGSCTVGLTGTANYNGDAGFSYTVTANGQTSNTASASFSVLPVDQIPVAADITPANFDEDVQSLITLSYTDGNTDQATSCSISALDNVTVTQACGCLAGICTVGVRGTANYNGSAGFSYTVTANGEVSNTASATFMILAANDAPNVPASLVCTINPPGAATGQICTLTAAGTPDVDISDTVTYADGGSTCADPSVSADGATIRFTAPLKGSTCVMKVQAFDGSANSAAVSSLTITGANNAPNTPATLSCPTRPEAGSAGKTCTLTAADPADKDAGDSITYSIDATSTCAGASVSSNGAIISFTAPALGATCLMKIKAHDGLAYSSAVSSAIITGSTAGPCTLADSTVTCIYSTNKFNVNLHTDAIYAGWNGVNAITINVTVNAGVIIGSTAVANSMPAFKIPDSSLFPNGTVINLINNGTIAGAGGARGSGVGGDAMWIASPTTLTNNGTIAGGGGGGGNGANGDCDGGGTGGGGAGAVAGPGASLTTGEGGSTTFGANGWTEWNGDEYCSDYGTGGGGGGLGYKGGDGGFGYRPRGLGGAPGSAIVGTTNLAAGWDSSGIFLGNNSNVPASATTATNTKIQNSCVATPELGNFCDSEGGTYIGDLTVNGTTYHYIAAPSNCANPDCSNNNVFGRDSLTLNWMTSLVVTGTGPDDGWTNTSTLISNYGISAVPAAAFCQSLTFGGHNDWFLPAKNELNLIGINRATIPGLNTAYYHSSTENNSSSAWQMNGSNGVFSTPYSKTNASYVRCVRKY